MTGQNNPLGWYCVSNDGRATLCMAMQSASSPWANNGGKRRRHVLPALSPTDVAEMRRRRALGDAVKWLARDFCVSVSTASEAIRGKRTYKSHQ